jgi:hypothetical protein
MNQPEASALYKKMLESASPIDGEAIIKVATDRGLSTAQVQMLAQIHNSASTMAHLRSSGNSDNRSDTFQTINVPELSAKYAALNVPLKDHPSSNSRPTPVDRHVNVVDQGDSDSWFTVRVASTKRDEVQVGEHFNTTPPVVKYANCPDCGGEDVKIASEVVCCGSCGRGYPDSITTPIKCAKELLVIDRFNANYLSAKIAAELTADKSMQAVNTMLRELSGIVKTARAVEIYQDVTMHGGGALELAIVKQASGTDYDAASVPKKFVVEDRHKCVELVKKIAAVMREASQADDFIEYVDGILPKLRDMKVKVASNDADALHAWLRWKAAAAAGGFARASRTSPEPTESDTTAGPAPRIDADQEQAYRDAAGGGGSAAPLTDEEQVAQEQQSPPREAVPAARPPYEGNMSMLPMEIPDDPRGQERQQPQGQPSVKKTLRELIAQAKADVGQFAPDRTKDNMTIRNGVRDAHAGAMLMRFMHLDDVISSAPPDRVMRLNDDLLASAPDITRQPERWRAALREMLTYDSPTVDGLTAQGKLTAGNKSNEASGKASKPAPEEPPAK